MPSAYGVQTDPHQARLMVVRLSKVLRRLLRKHETFSTLRDELSFIEDYLAIEVVRFGSTLRVHKDVAQDSLLLAFKALPGIEEPRKFGAWLSAITRHRALRFSQRETTHAKKRVPLDEALLEKIEALARPIADKERDEATIQALDSLPADYAMPLRLRFLDEMPLDRIAAFMGVPLSTVKWRIHHGKKLLRAKVEAS